MGRQLVGIGVGVENGGGEYVGPFTIYKDMSCAISRGFSGYLERWDHGSRSRLERSGGWHARRDVL